MDHVDVRTAHGLQFRRRDGGLPDYDSFWMKLEFEGVPFWMPNPPAHGRALRAHDVHHVLTGYGTDWVGEAEISAFELAGGCGRYVAAFGFDLMGTGLGVIAAPRRTFAAFVRGRHSTNLFRLGFRHAWLKLSVNELQQKLGLDSPREPTMSDYVAFGAWGSLAAVSLLCAPLTIGLTTLLCLMPAPVESD